MKKIAVALCVDDDNGMTFFGKRQSRDRSLISEFVHSNRNRPIYISPFSAKLFSEYEGINICEDPLGDCVDGGICFIENIDITPYLDIIDMIVLYRWNMSYPADTYFTPDLRKQKYRYLGALDIRGSSHDNITKESYKK